MQPRTLGEPPKHKNNKKSQKNNKKSKTPFLFFFKKIELIY